ncbi:hypothetical protein Tco_1416514, partial [Tanacetum coccineum]
MFSESSSRSPLESEEKTEHNLRRFSASEERNKIRMMELDTWVQSGKVGQSHGTLMKLPREALPFFSFSIIVDLLIPFAKRRSARSVVAKLVVAVCSYYIWQERNLHLFMNQKRSHSQ